MERIILHWTGGTHRPSALDRQHYHFIIAGDGQVVPGAFAVAANRGPLLPGAYAAHTRGCNTGSIGLALAAMAGAIAAPFDAGRHPVTEAQLAALGGLARWLMAEHHIALHPDLVLTHAEVQPRLGIAQRGKWDITWLPGMSIPGSPGAVGDRLRALIRGSGGRAPPLSAYLPHPSRPLYRSMS